MRKIIIFSICVCIACLIMSGGYGFWEKELKIIGNVEMVAPELKVDIAALQAKSENSSLMSNEIAADNLKPSAGQDGDAQQINEEFSDDNQNASDGEEFSTEQDTAESGINEGTVDLQSENPADENAEDSQSDDLINEEVEESQNDDPLEDGNENLQTETTILPEDIGSEESEEESEENMLDSSAEQSNNDDQALQDLGGQTLEDSMQEVEEN